MGYIIYYSLLVTLSFTSLAAQHLRKEEEPVVPLPYSFSYAAGRAPGHTDRVHAETSDGTGVVRGMFSYVDPRYQIRTVEYVADQNGFHPLLITNPVQDTRAVADAKSKHAYLYDKIAQEQARIAAERGQILGVDDGQYKGEAEPQVSDIQVEHPRDTPTVENAKQKHAYLYDKIAQDHARIALERGPEETAILQY